MLNHHKILLFLKSKSELKDISFNWLLLTAQHIKIKITLYLFQTVLRKHLDPDSDLWQDPKMDPKHQLLDNYLLCYSSFVRHLCFDIFVNILFCHHSAGRLDRSAESRANKKCFNFFSAGIYAVFIQEHITNAIGLRRSYQLGLAVFSISMAATVLLSTRSATVGHSRVG